MQVIQTILTSVARDGIRFITSNDHSDHAIKDILERNKPESREMKLRSHQSRMRHRQVLSYFQERNNPTY